MSDKIADKSTDGGTFVQAVSAIFVFNVFLPEVRASQFGFYLGFKDGLLYLNTDGSDDTLTDVFRGKILFVIVFEEGFKTLCHSLTEGSQVGTSVTGVLSVDKRRDVFAITSAVIIP